MIGLRISLAKGGYPVERVNPLPVAANLMVIMLEFQPYGARPVKGLADGSGVYVSINVWVPDSRELDEEDSVSVLVKVLKVVKNDVKVVKLSEDVSSGDREEPSWTGITLTAEVLTTRDAVSGGVLPPSHDVEPSCSAKEYGPLVSLVSAEGLA